MKLKHLISAFFALLFTATTFAQSQPVVIADTVFIVRKDNKFVQRSAQVYDNGEVNQPAGTIIGDTAQAITHYSTFFSTSSANIANDIRIILEYRRSITTLINFAPIVRSAIGINPLDTLIKKEPNLLSVDYWQVTSGATSSGIKFRLTTTGAGLSAFQWRADTSSAWLPAAFLGNVLRLYRYNGYNHDFVKSANGKAFISMSKQYRIQPIGQARDLSDIPDPEPLTPPQPELKPEFLAGGVVRYGELKYKYNTSKKKWETL